MSTQMHVAFSSLFMGVGMIGGSKQHSSRSSPIISFLVLNVNCNHHLLIPLSHPSHLSVLASPAVQTGSFT